LFRSGRFPIVVDVEVVAAAVDGGSKNLIPEYGEWADRVQDDVAVGEYLAQACLVGDVELFRSRRVSHLVTDFPGSSGVEVGDDEVFDESEPGGRPHRPPTHGATSPHHDHTTLVVENPPGRRRGMGAIGHSNSSGREVSVRCGSDRSSLDVRSWRLTIRPCEKRSKHV